MSQGQKGTNVECTNVHKCTYKLSFSQIFLIYFILSLRNEIIFLRFNQVPRRSKWEVAGKMRVARYGMASIPLQNSNFMVIGGQSNKTTGFSLTYQ